MVGQGICDRARRDELIAFLDQIKNRLCHSVCLLSKSRCRLQKAKRLPVSFTLSAGFLLYTEIPELQLLEVDL